MPTVTIELAERDNALALEVVDRRHQPAPAAEPRSIDERITAALAEAGQPQPFTELRARCRIRAATLYERLAAMTTTGRVVKSSDGYHLAVG
jgi:hypothetical protein